MSFHISKQKEKKKVNNMSDFNNNEFSIFFKSRIKEARKGNKMSDYNNNEMKDIIFNYQEKRNLSILNPQLTFKYIWQKNKVH